MKQTDNLKLNLFESTDPVLAASFNENSTKLDTAVAEAKALTETRYTENKQKITALTGKAVTFASGEYAGSGSESVTLTFDRMPVFVAIQYGNSTLLCFYGRDYAVSLNNINGFGAVSHMSTLLWNDGTKSLTINNASANHSNYTYRWTAFLADEI